LLLWAAATLKLIAAVLPLLAVNGRLAARWQRTVWPLTWIEGTILFAYGLVLTGVGLLIQLGSCIRLRTPIIGRWRGTHSLGSVVSGVGVLRPRRPAAVSASSPVLSLAARKGEGEGTQRFCTGEDPLAEAEQIATVEFECQPNQHRDQRSGGSTG